MTPRPTWALLGPLLGAAVLNLLARTSGDPWLALASGALLALPFASLLLRPALGALRVEHRAPARVVAGDLVEVIVRFRNGGTRATPPALWRHLHPGLEPVAAEVPPLLPGATYDLRLQREAVGRGVHRGGQSVLSTRAPFGLVRWTGDYVADQARLVVHPVTHQKPARLPAASDVLADRSRPVAGTGAEVLGLRPWRSGDSRRDVSARASARHGRPVVLQRERDAGPSLVLLATGGGFGPAWEAAISEAASLVLTALRESTPPVVIGNPAPNRVDAVGVLDFFAGLDDGEPLGASDLRRAVQLAGRAGTLVLLAPPRAGELIAQVHRLAAASGCRVEMVARG